MAGLQIIEGPAGAAFALLGLSQFLCKALFFVFELLGAFATGIGLGQVGFDFGLNGGYESSSRFRFATGVPQLGVQGVAGIAGGGDGALLLGDCFFAGLNSLMAFFALGLGLGKVELLLVEALFGFLDLGAVLFDALVELVAALFVEAHAGLRGVGGGAMLGDFLTEIGEFFFELLRRVARFCDGVFEGGKFKLETVDFVLEGLEVGFEFGLARFELSPVLVGEVGVENVNGTGELFIAAGLGDLTLERVHAAFLFGDDVAGAEEVGFGVFQFAEGFFFVLFELGDAGCFFEDRAAFFGLGRKDLVNLTLRHDGVSGATNAGVHEELVHVAEAAGFVVDAVLRFAIAEDAAGDGHFVELGFEGDFAIGHGHDHFGHAVGLAAVGAVEDDVGHFATAKSFGGSFAEDPADGVDDIGFAAAIGTDDAGNAGVEFEMSFIGERLEALDIEGFEVHEELVPSLRKRSSFRKQTESSPYI